MAHTDEGRLVEAARAGDDQAFGRLFDTWFDRVHDLSRRIVKDPGTAGEVAQDAFLTAWTRLDGLDDPDAFGGWLLRIARNASLNRLAKERRSVALDHDTMTTITDLDAPDHDPLAAMDQAARVDLVWDAAAALGARDLSVLDLHLRHGLGAGELAEELGTTPNNAHQILHTLRKRLGTNVRALVLWRAGRPACDDLRRTLATAGIATFDKAAVKVIDRHAGACASCGREREDRLAPAALFGAAPVVAAPILLKAEAASALAAAGVPMGGSTALGAGAAGGSGAGTGTGPTPIRHPSGPPGTRARRRRHHLALVTAAALVVLAVIVAVGSSKLDDGQLDGTEEISAGATDGAPVVAAPTSDTDQTTPTPIEAPTTDSGDLEVGPAPGGGADQAPAAPDVSPGTPAPAPPTTAPPGSPAPTPPPTPPAPPAPPPTSPPTEPPPPAPVPPEIIRFSAVNRGEQCRGGLLYRVTWATENATGVTVGMAGGSRQDGPPSGSIDLCSADTAPRFLLVAVGPDGTVQREISGTRIG